MTDFVVIVPAALRGRRGSLLRRSVRRISLIRHTLDSAMTSRADRVVLAADVGDVKDEARGCEFVLIESECRHGTDRVAAAAERLGLEDHTIVVGLQAFEPRHNGENIDWLASQHDVAASERVSTLVSSSPAGPEREDVRAIVERSGVVSGFDREAGGVRHLGCYAYRVDVLRYLASLQQGPEAKRAGLEQLDWMPRVVIYAVRAKRDAPPVKSSDEYRKFCRRYTRERSEKQY